MAKVKINVPVDFVREGDAITQVIKSEPNRRFVIFGTNLAGDTLVSLVGAAVIVIGYLAAASVAPVSRALHVTRTSTRFRVFSPNADGVNIAEEAELTYTTFRDLGDLVTRCADGDIDLGATEGDEDPGNALVVDQVDGVAKFVHLAAIPEVTECAIITRDVATASSLFEAI